MNALIKHGVAMFNAISALRLKRHHLVSTSEGVEVHQPGRPVLLITHHAAEEFAHMTEEGSND